jgi:predicted flap endonuclease-1-like 5' DNA nuclease/septal ring factor EnvC (AmiA/AmiB activator)
LNLLLTNKNIFFMNYTYLLNVCDITTPMLLLGMLIPALLGYLLRHFMSSKGSGGSTNANASLTDDWSSKYAKLEADYTSLQSKFSVSSNASANTGNLESQVKKLQGNISSYEGDIKKLRADLETANMKLKGFANVDVNNLQAKIQSLENNNYKLQANITSLSGSASSLEETQAQAEALKNKLAQLENDNATLKLHLEKSEKERLSIVRSEDNIIRYKEDVRDLSGKVGALTVENNRLKQEAADAKKTNRDVTEELAHNQGQLKISKADDTADDSKLKENAATIATLQAQLNDANAKAENAAKLAADLNAAQAKLKETEINLSSAKLKLEQSTTGTPTEKIVEVEVEKIVNVEVPVQVIKEVEKIVEVPSAADKKRIADLESELYILKAAPTETPTNNNTSQNATATTITAASKADDLLVIEGIGPKVNELFTAKGITTYAQLAAMPKEEVAAVLDGGGARFKILNGNSWPKQAELLRDGKMEEFAQYTDYLIAGVDPAEVKVAAVDVTPDDLKIVEGIGPKIEQLLNADGIYTFDQLAKSTYSQIKDVLDNAGPRYQMHDPSTWAAQAALARDGKTEELKKLQDELKGGRE